MENIIADLKTMTTEDLMAEGQALAAEFGVPLSELTKDPAIGVALLDHFARVQGDTQGLVERCLSLRDLRAKEGRVLSRATIGRLREVHQAHAAVGDQLASMIADHDAAEGGKEAERLFAAYLQLQARLRGVPA